MQFRPTYDKIYHGAAYALAWIGPRAPIGLGEEKAVSASKSGGTRCGESIQLRVMAESTSPAAIKDGDGSVAGGGTTGSGGTSASSGNGKVAFVTGINGQVGCEDPRTSR